MIKLVMQYRATMKEILDVTQQPIILFTPLLENNIQICNHIVPQTSVLTYAISCLFCLFFFFFVGNHVLILYT